MLRERTRPGSHIVAVVVALVMALPLIAAGGDAAAAGEDPSAAPPTDGPVIRLKARERRNTESELFAAMIEGRLIARAREAGRYHMVTGQAPADYELLIDIMDMRFVVQAEYDRAYDPQTDPNQPAFKRMLSGELDVDLILGKTNEDEPVFEDSIGFVSSHVIEPPEDRLESLIIDDLLEKLSNRVSRILRKRIKR